MSETGNTARDNDIYRLVKVYGWTQQRAADKYGISQPTVSLLLADMERRHRAPSAEQLREESRLMLQEVRRRQLEISRMPGAPVTAGKDGIVLVDPDTGEVVRDQAAILKALADATRTDSELAKRFGLDAPQKAQVEQKITYEVIGVDTGDLT